jgi:signal transduction histidine kinase
MSRADPSLAPRQRAVATMLGRGAAALAALTAAVVLVGWIVDLPALTRLGQSWTPMVVSTAITVLLGAVGTWAVSVDSRAARLLQRACGSIVMLLALPVLVNDAIEALRGAPLYTTGAAWRMAPNTALVALLFGASVLLLALGARWRRIAEALAAGALFGAMVMLVGFLFGAAPMSDLMGDVNMSPITGLCFATLSIGLLLTVQEGWLAGLIAGDGPGSIIARRMIAIIVFGNIALGLVRANAERHGLFRLEYGVALMVVGAITMTGLPVLWAASFVNRRDEDRKRELERQRFLSHASEMLGASVELRPTLAAVATLAVPRIADWCSIALCRADGSLDTVSVVHSDPAKVRFAEEYARRFPTRPDDPTGAAAVARTGKPEFYAEISDELLRMSIRDASQLEIVRALGMRSVIIVPLRIRERSVGVLSLVTAESGRIYTEDDIRGAQLLADRCASAIDNAKLFEELEQRVAERTAQLQMANRELEAFSYSVSHDLRTPLRALDGFSQAVLEDYGDKLDDTGKDYLNRIRRGSQRMGDLIDSLLELSRVSRGTLRQEHVDLSAIAHDITDGLREHDPDRDVCVAVTGDLSCLGDPRLLRALLENLLSNAWKFTSKTSGARIEFGLAPDNGRGRRVHVVRDNGAGFDMVHATKLFGAFQRLHTDREFQGTGVGLATAQRIVHRHGGEIWAESEPGRGASFYFTLG